MANLDQGAYGRQIEKTLNELSILKIVRLGAAEEAKQHFATVDGGTQPPLDDHRRKDAGLPGAGDDPGGAGFWRDKPGLRHTLGRLAARAGAGQHCDGACGNLHRNAGRIDLENRPAGGYNQTADGFHY